MGRAEDPIIDRIDVALGLAVRCLSRDDAVAVLDSVLNLGLLRLGDVLDVLGDLPKSFRDYAELVDPGAQSGIETRFRLGCRALNLLVRSQVQIEGWGGSTSSSATGSSWRSTAERRTHRRPPSLPTGVAISP